MCTCLFQEAHACVLQVLPISDCSLQGDAANHVMRTVAEAIVEAQLQP